MTIDPQFMLVRPRMVDDEKFLRESGAMTAVDPIPASTDPLGAALHSLRMSGMFYCRSHLSAPWGLTLPPMDECVGFHRVIAGRALLEIDDTEPLVWRSGELALVPHGRGHRIRSEANVPAPMVTDLPHDYVSGHYAILRHGGDGESTLLICGAVRFDHPAA